MSLIPSPYDPDWTPLNQGVYNDGPGGGGYGNAGGSVAAALPAPPVPSSNIPIAASPGPNGMVPWVNPVSGYGFPFSSAQCVLTKNPNRAGLILQNLSTGLTAADVGSTLYYSFGRPAVVGQSLGLAPGVLGGPGIALVLDYVCPADSLYVAFGPAVGAGTTVGAVEEMAHSPQPSPGQAGAAPPPNLFG